MSNFCPECGNKLISPNAEICLGCGVRLRGSTEKSPGLAALCGLLFTGMGQVYNGDVNRGFLFLAGAVVGGAFFIIPGLAVAIYGVYDAYTTAKRMNAGEIPYRETSALHMLLFLIAWVFGVVAFLILTLLVTATLVAVLFSL